MFYPGNVTIEFIDKELRFSFLITLLNNSSFGNLKNINYFVNIW